MTPIKLDPPASTSIGTAIGWVPGWEVGHPERAEWTKMVSYLIGGEFFAIFDQAPDVEKVHPKYKQMTKADRLKVWCEFFSGLALFECSWNPKSESVDVGKKALPDTWSVGLFQLSVTDQANLGIKLGYRYEDLKDPLKNINLAIRIMANQIVKRKKIFIPQGETGNPGLYWATLHPGGKYDKTAAIQAMVAKVPYKDVSNVKPILKDDPTPWMTVAHRELGVSETSNPKRVIEYHSATSLKATDVKTAWCSSFANWCFKQVGIKGTNSAWARDWLKWGRPLKDPVYGCVAVYERNAPGGDSHVTFWKGHDGAYDLVINGNVGDKVCDSRMEKTKLLGYRWPLAEEHDVPVAFV